MKAGKKIAWVAPPDGGHRRLVPCELHHFLHMEQLEGVWYQRLPRIGGAYSLTSYGGLQNTYT